MNKITQLDALLPLRPAWCEAGYTLVFSNGVFDLLHLGHVRYLKEARALGDLLVVGLNSDASVRRLKGPGRPLVPQSERAELLAALACVDYVVIYDTDTAEHLVAALQPEVYVKGGDYARPAVESGAPSPLPPKPLPEATVVNAYGGRVVLVPYLQGYSTTELIERILRSDGRNDGGVAG
jgi:rfaE bifunctional protein nucleotidyltransferase chain/domain